MTTKGKLFMVITFFLLGVATGLVGGYKFAQNQTNNGNQVQVTVDGKVKKGSEVNINLDTDQEQAKKTKRRK